MSGTVRHRRVLRDNIQGITKPALTRLARTAGVKSMSGQMYDELRAVMKLRMEQVLESADIVRASRRAKTFNEEDIIQGIANVDVKLAFTNDPTSRRCPA